MHVPNAAHAVIAFLTPLLADPLEAARLRALLLDLHGPADGGGGRVADLTAREKLREAPAGAHYLRGPRQPALIRPEELWR